MQRPPRRFLGLAFLATPRRAGRSGANGGGDGDGRHPGRALLPEKRARVSPSEMRGNALKALSRCPSNCRSAEQESPSLPSSKGRLRPARGGGVPSDRKNRFLPRQKPPLQATRTKASLPSHAPEQDRPSPIPKTPASINPTPTTPTHPPPLHQTTPRFYRGRPAAQRDREW